MTPASDWIVESSAQGWASSPSHALLPAPPGVSQSPRMHWARRRALAHRLPAPRDPARGSCVVCGTGQFDVPCRPQAPPGAGSRDRCPFVGDRCAFHASSCKNKKSVNSSCMLAPAADFTDLQNGRLSPTALGQRPSDFFLSIQTDDILPGSLMLEATEGPAYSRGQRPGSLWSLWATPGACPCVP